MLQEPGDEVSITSVELNMIQKRLRVPLKKS